MTFFTEIKKYDKVKRGPYIITYKWFKFFPKISVCYFIILVVLIQLFSIKNITPLSYLQTIMILYSHLESTLVCNVIHSPQIALK